MKKNYIEDFINPKYYVHLDFNSLMTYTEAKKHNKASSMSRIIVSILMFIATIVCFVNSWWVALMFSVLLTFFSFPKTSLWLQSLMKVEFPNKFFWFVTLLLMTVSLSAMAVQKKADNLRKTKEAALAEQQRQAEIAEKQKQERIAKEKEQQRLDSLSFHLNLAEKLFNNKKIMEAVQEYKLALPFTDAIVKGLVSYKIANILYSKKTI